MPRGRIRLAGTSSVTDRAHRAAWCILSTCFAGFRQNRAGRALI